ncbi:MAG: hypothetical protein MUP61_00925 [Burkholderiales bacterium]|nr:hypothetical protein [Burkholderiales bacterium]
MTKTSRTYGRNSPEAAAHVIAALIAQDGRLDWREIEFLDGAGALQVLGIERGRFMEVLSRYLGARLGAMAAGRRADAGRLDAELDAIEDRTTQLVVAAMLLYLAEIDGTQVEERDFVQRVWERWNVTPQILEREMKIPLARSRAVYSPAAVTA